MAATATLTEPPFEIRVEPTGDYAEAETVEEAIYAARTLLEEAHDAGYSSPAASLYAHGRLVRTRVRRTDLAVELGRCWCGRGALIPPQRREAYAGFCCPEHQVLWRQWTPDLRARTIVAQFIYLYRPRGGR